jgi:hypothetical protein
MDSAPRRLLRIAEYSDKTLTPSPSPSGRGVPKAG